MKRVHQKALKNCTRETVEGVQLRVVAGEVGKEGLQVFMCNLKWFNTICGPKYTFWQSSEESEG